MNGMLQIQDSSRLLVAMETSLKHWRLAMGGQGQQRRCCREIDGGDYAALESALAEGKRKLGLPAQSPVLLCYEAGRDGFYPQRRLSQAGHEVWVVDASSIEVPRSRRHAKSDPLDADKLLDLLQRKAGGEARALRVVVVPSCEAEDLRQLPRERRELQTERTRLWNRLRSLLFAQGCREIPPPKQLADWLSRQAGLGEQLRRRVQRELVRLRLVEQQIAEVERSERQWCRQAQAPRMVQTVQRLCRLRGIDVVGAWVLSSEVYGWRDFANRRQVGGAFGLTPTPYSSGKLEHELGIGKDGNRRGRALLIELSWMWQRWQPQSSLTQWFHRRFGEGGKRSRRVGIVALARRLAVALWRYLEYGEVPAGAQLKAMS